MGAGTNNNPYTWTSPAPSVAFSSLSAWLLRPQFPAGLTIGSGVGGANDPSTVTTIQQVLLQVVDFTSTAAAAQVVAHGVAPGAIWFVQAYGKGASSQHVFLPITSVDGTNVTLNSTGVTAANGCHLAMLFSTDSTLRGW